MLQTLDVQQLLTVGLILFSATVVVRLAGFGASLVAMPMLVPLLGLPIASPLMKLFAVTNFGLVIFQRWQDLTLRDIWCLTLIRLAMRRVMCSFLGPRLTAGWASM